MRRVELFRQLRPLLPGKHINRTPLRGPVNTTRRPTG